MVDDLAKAEASQRDSLPSYSIMSFTQAVEFTLSWEGEWSQDPGGGLTRFGISQYSYPDIDLKTLTRQDAIGIYATDFWARCHCGEFPPAIALILFEAAVNQGPGQAIRIMQNALKVTADGIIGPVTIAAAFTLEKEGLVEFASRRAYQYGLNPLFMREGLGWVRRLMACLRLALSL